MGIILACLIQNPIGGAGGFLFVLVCYNESIAETSVLKTIKPTTRQGKPPGGRTWPLRRGVGLVVFYMPEITNGSVVQQNEDGSTEEAMLMTFSHEEQEENKINRANAKLLYSPEFIPMYLDIIRSHQLSLQEGLVYGFIRFYLGTSKKKRFYFSNKQLAEVIDSTEGSMKNIMAKLQKLGLVQASRKMKASGGLIRFVTSVTTDFSTPKSLANDQVKLPASDLHIKDNKIKDNKTNTTNVVLEETYGDSKINEIFSFFEKTMQFPSKGKKKQDRWMASHLLREFTIEQIKAMILFCATNEFAPRVGSVEKLWFKRGDIVAGIKASQLKSNLRKIVKI